MDDMANAMEPIAFLSSEWDPALWIKRAEAAVPGIDMRAWPDVGSDAGAIAYAVAWKPPQEALDALPNLKVIFSLGAGVDHIFQVARLPDVPVVRAVNADLTARMSEYVVLHTLMHHRRQRLYDRFQSERVWKSPPQPAAAEVRVGVMGLGVLGRDSAEKLKIMGFDVAGWSRSEKSVPDIPSFHGTDGLKAFLRRTDILVALLPHTPETDGILNHGLFSQLARDGVLGAPVLINAGRGRLQVEEDIVRALDDGTLGAVTLDVFVTEPLPANSPLWTHPNVTITPHNAADSDPDAITRGILRQIEAYERGEPLKNVVDPKKGY